MVKKEKQDEPASSKQETETRPIDAASPDEHRAELAIKLINIGYDVPNLLAKALLKKFGV